MRLPLIGPHLWNASGCRRKVVRVSSPRYPTVLFDWDGCLLASLDAWLVAYSSACVAFGVEPVPAAIVAQFGDWDLGKLGIAPEDQQRFVDQLGREAKTSIAEAGLYEGAADLLAALRDAGCQLGLVTSSWSREVLPALHRLGLSDAFDTVVSADDVRHHKPDAEPVLLALDRLGAAGDDAVMIGDSAKDIGAAGNADVDSILIHDDTHAAFHDLPELRRLGPTHVVASFRELADLLLPA